MSCKVAIITGSASGIGLAVAEVLSAKGWIVHSLDKNNTKSEAASKDNSNVIKHTTDVSSWPSISSAFAAAFKKQGRVDFVFANAGVLEKSNFFARHDETEDSSYSDENESKSPIAGVYAQELAPLYSMTKGAILTLARAIAEPMRAADGIRTYAICPGIVRTSFVADELWDAYPQELITPMSRVTDTVEMLIRGGRLQDSRGNVAEDGENHGLVVEIFCNEIFFRDRHHGWSDGLRYVLKLVEKSQEEYGAYLRPE
ncbi:hypothetical protein F5Y16DRAFT_415337 [Xylariaceae sp. FL0255]|nr:hypothetical protein F5Y16DRAFT_415337 [Xylariaceae sp. FL0255]